MLIDIQKNDIKVIGDVTEFKTGIDPENLDFITTLLSSNLYSFPEQSFMREIISNAWDSQVEAKTTDTPVLVKFSTTLGSVSIRDFGTGLSPERFREVYCNIGSSTKRSSNDYIGGFGIGKYSSLACSNTVYITSYYEGKAYHYIMIKNGNTITTNLVFEEDTEEKNGVEVSIKPGGRLDKFYEALRYLVFFPNVYVDGNNWEYNSVKIKHFNNFSCASIPIDNKILIGKVLYRLDSTILDVDNKVFIAKLASTGIVIKFDIGELDITPNRENIIYTTETVKLINDRISKAKEEIYTIISSKVSKDFDDIFEYRKYYLSTFRYDFINDKVHTSFASVLFLFNVSNLPYVNLTYKGKVLDNIILNNLTYLYSISLPGLIGYIDYDTFRKKDIRYYSSTQLSSDKLIIVSNYTKMYKWLQEYLKEKYTGFAVIREISYADFCQYLKDSVSNILDTNTELFNNLSIEIYNRLQNKATKIDIESQELQSVKEYFKDNVDSLKNSVSNFYVYEGSKNFYKRRLVFKNIDAFISFLKSSKKGIVLVDNENFNDIYGCVVDCLGYKYYSLSKKINKIIKDLNLNFVIDINKVLSCNRIKRDSIIYKCIKDNKYELLPPEFIEYLPYPINSKLLKLLEIQKSISAKPYEYTSYLDTLSYTDSYIENLCKLSNDYRCKILQVKNNIRNYQHLCTVDLTPYYITKNKLFRVNFKVYKYFNDKIKPLKELLCQK